MYFAFAQYDIDEIIPNKSLPNLWDLKIKSREVFKEIVSKPKHMVEGKPVFFRFSELTRQPQPPID